MHIGRDERQARQIADVRRWAVGGEDHERRERRVGHPHDEAPHPGKRLDDESRPREARVTAEKQGEPEAQAVWSAPAVAEAMRRLVTDAGGWAAARSRGRTECRPLVLPRSVTAASGSTSRRRSCAPPFECHELMSPIAVGASAEHDKQALANSDVLQQAHGTQPYPPTFE